MELKSSFVFRPLIAPVADPATCCGPAELIASICIYRVRVLGALLEEGNVFHSDAKNSP